jgi:hypothetical protein
MSTSFELKTNRELIFDKEIEVRRMAARLQGEMVAKHAKYIGRKISEAAAGFAKNAVRFYGAAPNSGASGYFADYGGKL